jgi:SAM-dependent methyltransferase
LSAYGDDLAYIHDTGHGDFARESAPGIISLLRSCGVDSGLVADLGCGSGILAAELLDAGYDVLGVDISESMLAIARQRAPAARFVHASFLDFNLPPCSAVVSISECIGYRLDQGNSLDSLAGLFERIYAALHPGGLFVFDFLQPGVISGFPVIHRHREGSDWAVLVDLEADPTTAILTRRITSFRQVGDLYRRDHEVHEVQLMRAADLDKRLRNAGFTVQRLRAYGQRKFRTGHVGLLARK